MRFRRAGGAVIAAVVACALTACGTADEPTGSSSTSSTAAATSATTTGTAVANPEGAALPGYTPGGDPKASTLSAKCGVDAQGTVVRIPLGGDNALAAIDVGIGPDVAVYIHDMGMAGMCPWGQYAAYAASQGVHGVVMSLCEYEIQRCTPQLQTDRLTQVRAVVDWARARGADQVSVVGVGLGGGIALGVGQRAGADSVVDLSGMVNLPDVPAPVEAARATTVPLLVAAARGDNATNFDLLEEAVEASPAKVKRLVELPDGTGYDLVQTADHVRAFGEDLVDWFKGDHTLAGVS